MQNSYDPALGAKRKQRRGQYTVLPYVMTFPLLAFIGALAIYPTIMTFVQSFYNLDPLNPPTRFVGIKNYLDIFHDPTINFAWANTWIYVLFGVVIATVLAVLIALGLWEKFPGRGAVLAILILPWALPGVTEGIIWGWIYDPSFGVLNSVLKSLHLINHYHMWISGNRVATIFFIELVQIWQITPLATVLILASLQNIPVELFEAARIDGAGKWKATWSITLPLIRPGLAIAVIQNLIASLNVFDQAFVLNGDATTATTIMLKTYNITFQNLNFGQGYSLSFVTMILTMVISVGLLKVVYRKVEF